VSPDIGAILHNELERAFTNYFIATEQFNQILSSIQSSSASSHDLENMQAASRERRDGLQALGFAAGRLHDYVLTGIVPPDISDAAGKPH
jgi:hypothetical protein